MLAFGNVYDVPGVIPQKFGFKWWGFIFSRKNLVSSIALSFLLTNAFPKTGPKRRFTAALEPDYMFTILFGK
jgi:hypothetical protein